MPIRNGHDLPEHAKHLTDPEIRALVVVAAQHGLRPRAGHLWPFLLCCRSIAKAAPILHRPELNVIRELLDKCRPELATRNGHWNNARTIWDAAWAAVNARLEQLTSSRKPNSDA